MSSVLWSVSVVVFRDHTAAMIALSYRVFIGATSTPPSAGQSTGQSLVSRWSVSRRAVLQYVVMRHALVEQLFVAFSLTLSSPSQSSFTPLSAHNGHAFFSRFSGRY